MFFLRSHCCAGMLLMLFGMCMPAAVACMPPAAWQQTDAPARQEASELLHRIERAIAAGDARGVAQYFAPKVYLNLPAGENGYYSAEQSYHMLRGFFRTYPVNGFSFSSSAAGSDAPYGVGTLASTRQGHPVTLQLFVSLTRFERGWRIAQITAVRR